MKTIDQLIDEVIGREGNYSAHPADLGGATKWGITEQVARAYGWKGDMRDLPRDFAVSTYKQRYWLGPRLDQVAALDAAIGAEMFDAAVNMGPAKAIGFLQRALNVLNRQARDYPDIAADGAIGPMTIAALRGYRARRPDPEGGAVLLWLIRALRGGRYVEIAEANPSQEIFEYGWIARMVRMAA